MALSNLIAGTVVVGVLAAPLATAPTAEMVRLRAIANNPSVIAALAASRGPDSPAATGYVLAWEQRLLALEHGARLP